MKKLNIILLRNNYQKKKKNSHHFLREIIFLNLFKKLKNWQTLHFFFVFILFIFLIRGERSWVQTQNLVYTLGYLPPGQALPNFRCKHQSQHPTKFLESICYLLFSIHNYPQPFNYYTTNPQLGLAQPHPHSKVLSSFQSPTVRS